MTPFIEEAERLLRLARRELIILLAGGDKTTQARDIKAALRLARNLSE